MSDTMIAILMLGGTGFILGIGGLLLLRWHERRYPGR